MKDTVSTEGLPERTRDSIRVKRFRLHVIDGPDASLTYEARRERVQLGTHRSTDLALHDRTMSRFHCEITLVDGRPILRDLGSRNGTLVDGVPVLTAPLRAGAILTLGRTRMRFEDSGESLEIPLSDRDHFGLLVGTSPVMRALFHVLEVAARRDTTVLLQGETGTGKDLAAESLHLEGSRGTGPFVVVDCAAVSPTVIESELFGHERGAFTGAVSLRIGAFEAAHGGTLFLDEIGELPLDMQPKLLRAIEKRTVQRVGGATPLPADVRVIAATNRNLRAEVNAGRFRPDLYYRLAVLDLRLPPLRERLEDLPILVRSLVERLGPPTCPESADLLSEQTLAELRAHAWPGNVRELKNHLERRLARVETLPPGSPASGPDAVPDPSEPFRIARRRWERRYLLDLLRRHGGNVTEAARAARIDRAHLHRLLGQLGIKPHRAEPA